MDSTVNVTEIQLSYKSNAKSSTRYKINSPQDAYGLLTKYFPDDIIEYKESFKVVLLNQSNKVLGIIPISEGGISATYVDVRLILQATLLANVAQVILTHSHPSGSMKPSTLDDALTGKVRKGTELMEIYIADHTILSPEKEYYPHHDEGKLQTLSLLRPTVSYLLLNLSPPAVVIPLRWEISPVSLSCILYIQSK